MTSSAIVFGMVQDNTSEDASTSPDMSRNPRCLGFAEAESNVSASNRAPFPDATLPKQRLHPPASEGATRVDTNRRAGIRGTEGATPCKRRVRARAPDRRAPY